MHSMNHEHSAEGIPISQTVTKSLEIYRGDVQHEIVDTLRSCASCGALVNDDQLSIIIIDESEWRRPQILGESGVNSARLIASRWRNPKSETRAETAESPADYYTIAIAIRRTILQLSISGRLVHDGLVTAGMLQVCDPGERIRGIFHAPSDFLHLHVPSQIIAELYKKAEALPYCGGVTFDPCFFRDASIERLGRTLVATEATGAGLERLHVDYLCLAIVARILRLRSNRGPLSAPRGVVALPKWRLKRVVDYIEAHIAEPLSLADLAASAGLSHMYFAAQFRAATGLRPHEYLLRQRIERAQAELLSPNSTLLDVALSVGFQTPAHFTTVFKRFVGETPCRWRQKNCRG
jgi:AraC family transcriptional regulator